MNYIIKLGLSLMFLFSQSLVYANDARTYYLMPKDTELTELKYSYNEVTSPNGKQLTENQTETLKHIHYFSFNDNLAAMYLILPYTDIKQTTQTTIKSSGFSDATILFAWGVYNMPALSKSDYIKFDKNGVSSACSIAFILPTGSYKESNRINPSSNRHSQNAECQIGYRQDKIMYEFTIGIMHYSANNSYIGKNNMKQDNLIHAETHISYNLLPNLWTSFDTFYYNGGNVSLNNKKMDSEQNLLQLGASLGYVINNNNFLKMSFQDSVKYTKTTSKQKGFTISYNYIW